MIAAQIWLDNNIPANLRNGVTKLLILPSSQRDRQEENDRLISSVPRDTTFDYYLNEAAHEVLTGTLDLSDFTNLKSIRIEKQHINKLILTGCQHLETIEANNNLLREIVLPWSTNCLERVYLTNNNFRVQDLSCFANYTNLKTLFLGTDDETRIGQGIYNRWDGSLGELSRLQHLEELDINATDIDRGLEYLPTNHLFYFTFGNQGRVEAGVDCLKNVLEDFAELEAGETLEQWATNEDLDDNSFKVRDVQNYQTNQARLALQNLIQVNNQ
ncbi:MAG: hypothetical protein MRERV_2c101 [Mycoplasmataceae bacterium RV_VA103A]|nr:MAG: hypothetical protein MRERV_2c101 [Mycoplasmataceae bacterium RV_VA103A]